MKKKLMVLALLAGGSMFAQTRFSVGVSVGSNRGYYGYAPAAADCPPVYNNYGYSYAVPSYDYGYSYTAPSYNYGYSYVAPRYSERSEYRGFNRDRDRDHDRFRYDRDDDRGRRGFRSDDRGNWREHDRR